MESTNNTAQASAVVPSVATSSEKPAGEDAQDRHGGTLSADANARLADWDVRRLVTAGISERDAGGIAVSIAKLRDPDTNPHFRPQLAKGIAKQLQIHAASPGVAECIGALQSLEACGPEALKTECKSKDARTAPPGDRPVAPRRCPPLQNSDTAPVDLARIVCDERVQAREGLDEQTVQDYVEAMQAGAEFPPVVVFGDVNTGGLTLADGFHRVAAARQAGRTHIPAEVRKGTIWDALRHALGANSVHGLRRTRKDIARAIGMAYEHRAELGLPDVPSARLVAELVGCSDKTAETELRKFRSWAQATTRTGVDGKTRAVPRPRVAVTAVLPPNRPTTAVEADAPTPPASEPAPVPQPSAHRDVEAEAGSLGRGSSVPSSEPFREPAAKAVPQDSDSVGLRALVVDPPEQTAQRPVGTTDPSAEDVLRLVVEELESEQSPAANNCLQIIRGRISYRYPAFYERLRDLFAAAPPPAAVGV